MHYTQVNTVHSLCKYSCDVPLKAIICLVFPQNVQVQNFKALIMGQNMKTNNSLCHNYYYYYYYYYNNLVRQGEVMKCMGALLCNRALSADVVSDSAVFSHNKDRISCHELHCHKLCFAIFFASSCFSNRIQDLTRRLIRKLVTAQEAFCVCQSLTITMERYEQRKLTTADQN